MDEDLRERVEREAETAALFNALKHGSDAQVGAIMGPLMGENPEFREHGDEIPGVIAPVCERVNDLADEAKRDRLAEVDPDAVAELEAEAEAEEQLLPDLPDVADHEEVRMRLAPNPNGPWHLGNARMPAVIGTYKSMYDGWMLCRFDDTDPETKRPDLDAYDGIIDAIDYLGFEPDEVVRASDRVETYYEHARDLIDAGGAYACTCSQEQFSELKADAEPCPHRGQDADETHAEFDRMVAGEYESGEMVLRVRTDIEQKNPALRDWVAFRMVDTPHPREAAAEYRCWPMLDFQSAIDDHLFDITHIIRGIDLQDSAKRQGFLYDYFGWEYPEVTHWGRIEVDEYDVPLSTSSIKERIAEGELDGWDDPRAPTLASLERRGVRGGAVVAAMTELGVSTSSADLSMSAIYSANRERVDEGTDRAFLVRDGERLPVDGGPDAGHPPVHPEHEDRGRRDVPLDDAVLLEPGDVPAEGDRVWLKGWGPVRNEDGRLVHTDEGIEVVREEGVDVVHWVDADENVPVTMRTMDGDVSGRAEPGVGDYGVDDLLQFERVGFVRLDDVVGDELTTYFTHA
ncbi:glutamate--tRNA ligase [Haloglomus irregulare]|jgi:glutamyl-tRNA synthetase|uniref:Glutamate--tRNA ligase n=1 Tax=Haloglomus irregulare TaxID=2234134 RepID=A0A554N7I0_9EURY|nr:glutamate--tRNA ligase [Haloglomus irregulare]TSD13352.1 glutamate--tRNA ligase [Haloglomus irregulare]